MKYGRTYHFPFSPGTTSDDRICHEYWDAISSYKQVIHTEKLDGENNCLSAKGVFARSHSAPTVSPWTRTLREKWESMKLDLGDYEIFGENLYAIHSIEYTQLRDFYFVFAVRRQDYWLSWEEVAFVAALFDLPTVPLLTTIESPLDKLTFEKGVLDLATHDSVFGAIDAQSQIPCTREGIVSRNADEYPVEMFGQNVFKYVRKNHVKTDEHWTRTWKKARIIY